jgi:hypothetical protein
MQGGHSCPPLLILVFVEVILAIPIVADVPIGPIESQNKNKISGQECPLCKN